jgi:hypothetical protein
LRGQLAPLEQALVGYRFTFAGSVVGLAYGFLFGFCAVYSLAVLYNAQFDFREPGRHGHT